MTPLSRRTFLATSAASLAAPALGAEPQPYLLDKAASKVGFIFTLAGNAQRGTMPVTSADIQVDAADLAASSVDVRVDAAGARTNLFFATQAMKSAEVLDVAAHPTIRFVSKEVELGTGGRLSDGAKLQGDLTLRGVTKPVEFEASLYRKPGSAAKDLSELSIQLHGQISRSAFGATGYPDLVPDPIVLDIFALIRRAP
ncbi:YceI family protein [Ruegeria sp. 2205SS24-7]|uniref:YceI family protein n=1 Tax=Ruegeria discodermiae TaxID=3064389 RepID=UPI002741362D|nr:YceI family protein [Ruegeria sp. 2205SS24-7]MDP5215724.1 YceI family protein [Ruegeria sp. 2205SS24-7]